LAALLLFRALRRRGSRLTPGIAVVLAIATVGVLVGNAAGGSAWPNVPTSFFPRSGLLFAALAVLRDVRAGLGEAAAG
jgi:lipopolysaccharide export LptBFGC system permease protein LptF